MRTNNIIHTVSCHTEGEVGDVIVGGVAPPPGKTVWEQACWIAQDDSLRNFMLNEPRGGVFRHVNLLVPAKDPKAQMGWIIMEPEDTPPMSGSNSICVATVLLETGIIEMQEPQTTMTLESPGGLINVVADCENGKVTQVTIANVPSFIDQMDATIEVSGLGNLTVTTAYGGDSFVIVNAEDVGFAIKPDEARAIAELGIKITEAANEQLGFSHPANPDWRHISFCQFAAPLKKENAIWVGRNTVVIQPGKLDRCPTGTGCSARMALMYAKGQLNPGEIFIGESILGARFQCSINSTTSIGNKEAINPVVTGRAWITGTHQHTLDPTDPWPQGYRVSDTWPMLGKKINGDRGKFL